MVLLLSEKLALEECRPMMQGGSLPLCSSFRLRCDTPRKPTLTPTLTPTLALTPTLTPTLT